MPGGRIVGNRHRVVKDAKQPSLLPAETRNLTRLLKMIGNPEQAKAVLMGFQQQSQSSVPHHRESIRSILCNLDQQLGHLKKQQQSCGTADAGGWLKNAEMEMAKTVQKALDRSGNDLFLRKTNQRTPSSSNVVAGRPKRTGEDDDDDDDDDESSILMPPPTPNKGVTKRPSTTTTSLIETRSPLMISDSDSAREEEQQEQQVSSSTTSSRNNAEMTMMDFWSHLLEHVHLHVSSCTRQTWGRPKTYEVYRLSGPATSRLPIFHSSSSSSSSSSNPDVHLDRLRKDIERQFLSIYDGCCSSSSTMRKSSALRYSECRVYALQRDEHELWIQINIGRAFDPNDECNLRDTSTAKKDKEDREFVALIHSECFNLVTLTASRAPSRSRFTPYVLSALDGALTCSSSSAAAGYGIKEAPSRRIEDLSGNDPHELLRSARAVELQGVVGRFATYAANPPDPVQDLHAAATEPLLLDGRLKEQQERRLEVGAKHGRKVARLAATASSGTTSQHGKLVASNASGTRTLVDRSAGELEGRKRARDRDLGAEGALPKRTCLRWDWTGETTAAAAAVVGRRGIQQQQQQQEQDVVRARPLSLCKFKCRVKLQGSDVFGGMRAMMEAGIMKGPLPHYIKNAASLGEGGAIVVDHGAVRTRVDKQQHGNNR